MVLIQDVTSILFRDIISWVAAILHILILVKLFMLLSKSFNGFGNLNRRSKNKPSNSTPDDTGEDPKKVKNDIEKDKDLYRKAGLNPDKPGRITLLALDPKGNPISHVKIEIWMADRKAWDRLTKKKVRNVKPGKTMVNGFSNQEYELPAGMWKYSAKKRGWTHASGNTHFQIMEDDEPSGSKRLQIVKIYLKRRNNPEDGFSPLIIAADDIVDKKGKKRVRLEGIIN